MTIVDHCRAEAQHLTPPLRSLPGKTLQCFWVFAESAVSPSSSAESEGPPTTTHRKLSVLLVTSLLLGGPIYIWATWYQVPHTTLCSLLGAALLWCNRHTGQCNRKVSWVFRSDINNGQQLALLCFVFFPLPVDQMTFYKIIFFWLLVSKKCLKWVKIKKRSTQDI